MEKKTTNKKMEKVKKAEKKTTNKKVIKVDKKTTNKFGKQCTTYQDSVKNDVVNKILVDKKTASELSEQLNIPVSTVHGWVAKHKNKNITKYRNKRGGPYDREFKIDVVKKIKEEGKDIVAVSKLTGVSKASISNWIITYWTEPRNGKGRIKKEVKGNTNGKNEGKSLTEDMKKEATLAIAIQQRDYYRSQMEHFMSLYFQEKS